MQKKYYLAGPMTGIPQHNFPLSYKAAADLRSRELDIVLPADMDNPKDAALALASKTGSAADLEKTWGDFLASDVKMLADTGITGIVFLPGWVESKGAKLEGFVGLLLGFEFFQYTPTIHGNGFIQPISKYVVLSKISANICEMIDAASR